MNIFRVHVFQVTSKGKNVLAHETVVKFDGEQSALHSLMSERYEGFRVHVSEIKEIKQVVSLNVEENERATDGQFGHYYLKGRMSFSYKEYVDTETLESFRKAMKEVNKIGHVIQDKILQSLNQRVEIAYVDCISILHEREALECTVRVKADLYKTSLKD